MRFQGLIGIVVLLAIAWAFSVEKKRVPWRVIAVGLGLNFGFALLILKTAPGQFAFDFARRAVSKLISFSGDGASFLFGLLGKPGAQLQLLDSAAHPVSFGFAVAFQVLPVIVFFSSLIGILYHLGLMQRIVQGFAFVMRRTMKISGAESLATAAEIFVGNIESPMTIRPYLASMTRSELATIMTAGFATVAGSVMAAYIGFGIDAGHLLAASVMNAPAAIIIAKIMFPEIGTPETIHGAATHTEDKAVNVIDAAANGAIQGLKVAATVGAMLIAFLSLIALINYLLGFFGTSLGGIFGYLCAPIAWCIGIGSGDILAIGQLLGTKTAVNELVAYLMLIDLHVKGAIAERSFVIATYALCGFANFGSIAITIGGVGQLAPSRRQDLARLGLKTMLGGGLASCLSAAIASVLI